MAQPRDKWVGNAFLIVNSYEGHPELSCLQLIDRAALDFWTTFQTLRFQTVVWYNRTRQEFERDIRAFIQTVAQDASTKYVVFFFIGHGGAGDILFLHDGSLVTVEEIDDMFSQLKSKFRILIIDACRGQGVIDGPGGYSPKYPNTILARSTLPHQKAWDTRSYGMLVFRRLYLVYNVASLPILMCSNMSLCMYAWCIQQSRDICSTNTWYMHTLYVFLPFRHILTGCISGIVEKWRYAICTSICPDTTWG